MTFVAVVILTQGCATLHNGRHQEISVVTDPAGATVAYQRLTRPLRDNPVPLPDGRVAWLYSDTFLGTVNPDHSRPAHTPLVPRR